jgi:hypothetical protein
LAELSAEVVSRECGTCSLCCKLLGIGALDKPAGSWCAKCAPPHGCTIYDTRPQECRDFACVWLESKVLGDEWKPSRSKIVLYLVEDGRRLIAHVDAGTPNAWREKLYYDQLKLWARRGIRSGPSVVVRVGDRLIAILPDRDVDLGRVAKGDGIFIGERLTSSGPRYVAEVIPASDAGPAVPKA